MAMGGHGRIETGTASFRFYKTGNPIEKGEPKGERCEVKFVKFNEEYHAPPKVLVSLSGLDSDSGTNVRVEVTAQDITRDGFVARVKTWWDTKLYGVTISWLAIN